MPAWSSIVYWYRGKKKQEENLPYKGLFRFSFWGIEDQRKSYLVSLMDMFRNRSQ